MLTFLGGSDSNHRISCTSRVVSLKGLSFCFVFPIVCTVLSVLTRHFVFDLLCQRSVSVCVCEMYVCVCNVCVYVCDVCVCDISVCYMTVCDMSVCEMFVICMRVCLCVI